MDVGVSAGIFIANASRLLELLLGVITYSLVEFHTLADNRYFCLMYCTSIISTSKVSDI